jgi:hypothetical protein
MGKNTGRFKGENLGGERSESWVHGAELHVQLAFRDQGPFCL